jgi:hypothetical protein
MHEQLQSIDFTLASAGDRSCSSVRAAKALEAKLSLKVCQSPSWIQFNLVFLRMLRMASRSWPGGLRMGVRNSVKAVITDVASAATTCYSDSGSLTSVARRDSVFHG